MLYAKQTKRKEGDNEINHQNEQSTKLNTWATKDTIKLLFPHSKYKIIITRSKALFKYSHIKNKKLNHHLTI